VFKLFIAILLIFSIFGFKRCLASGNQIIINEIYPAPETGESEWIELINNSKNIVSLSDYTIEDNTGKVISLAGKVIVENGLIVLEKGADYSFSLNNDGDIINLRENGVLSDAIAYGDYDDGNIIDNAPKPIQGESISRQIGKESGVPANDFAVMIPTKGGENRSPVYSSEILIDEIMPAPSTGGHDEFIELYNSGKVPVDMSGWYIDDMDGGSRPYRIDTGIYIEPGGYLTVYNQNSHLVFNNSSDAVRLFDPNGQLRSQVYYSGTKRGKSYQLCTNSWGWAEPTASKLNSKQSQDENVLTPDRNQTNDKKTEKTGTITVPPGVFSSHYGYIQNEEEALELYSYKGDFPLLSEGDLVRVEGELSYPQAVKRIKVSKADDIEVLGQNSIPSPLEIEQEPSLDLLGFFTLINGKLLEKNETGFLIKTDSNFTVMVRNTVKISRRNLAIGDRITAQGILSSRRDGFEILPRSIEDVKVVNLARSLPVTGADSPIASILISLILCSPLLRMNRKQSCLPKS